MRKPAILWKGMRGNAYVSGVRRGGGFTGDEKAPKDGVLRLGVRGDCWCVKPAAYCRMTLTEWKMSGRYATCLGGIDFTGRFED